MVQRVALRKTRRLRRRNVLLRNRIGLQGFALGKRTSQALFGCFWQTLTELYVLLRWLFLLRSLGPGLILQEISVDEFHPLMHGLAVSRSEQPLLQLSCLLELHLEGRNFAGSRRASE